MSIYIDNFETIYGTKGSIQALRNKVLELAIRGKLVPQDPNDEPASELIKNIHSEKEKLLKEGKIKKQRSISQIQENEGLFQIPESWNWVKFSDIVRFNIGKTPQRNDNKFWTNGVYNWVSIADMTAGEYIYDTKEKVSEFAFKDSFKGNISKSETLIMSFKLTVGKVSILKVDSFHNEAIISIYPFLDSDNSMRDFLFKTLPLLSTYGNTKSAIKGDTLNSDSISNILVPLPPLAEQQRIVAKVESLMAEIDKLEEYLQNKERLMGLLSQVVVDVIGDCKNEEELKEQLQFVISNFETIFQTPESMQDLRNVILQLAIEGKLVPQDPNDEPAAELIKKIQAEKDALVENGKIKKQNLSLPIEDDGVPFEIPANWAWARLGDVGDSFIGLTYSPANVVSKGLPVLRSNNINNGKMNYDELVFVNNEVKDELITKKDDILICARNGSKRLVGKSALIDEIASNKMTFGAFMALFRSEINKYVYLMLNSNLFRSQLGDSNTMTVNQVTQSMLRNIVIPIPPLAEQHRIIAKVESIMNLIDQMETEMKRKVDLVEKMASA